jgi:hypothetical protein
MALNINGTRGGLTINNGYLLITMVQMQRFLRPTTVSEQVPQEDGTIITVQRATVVSDVQYIARGQVYESASAREQSFGATDLNFAFSFNHVDGSDQLQEAYEFIKTNGLQGWTLTGMSDL